MTGDASSGTQAVLDEVLATRLPEHPDVVRHLTEAHDAAWATVDPRLLELCRLRVATPAPMP